MKKLYILVLILLATATSFGQTIYSENMGTPTATTLIPAYITGTAPATFQNASPIIYSGTVDVRSTTPSSVYSGASGGGNIFFSTSAGVKVFQIDGINTSAYLTANIRLTFGINVSAVTSLPTLEFSTNASSGTPTWTAITIAAPAAIGWSLVSIAGGILPASNTLSLRFTQPTVQTAIRIDDVKVFNFNPACTLALGTVTGACDAVTSAIDTDTATIPYTGGGSGTHVITPSSGTVAGDNPNTVAAGNILITGISEGTALTVNVANGVCNYSAELATGPECKPVNALPIVESFPYAATTSLGTSQMWTSVNLGDAIAGIAGNLNYTGYTSSGNSTGFSSDGAECFTSFTTTTTGTVYYSYLLNVASMTGVTDANGGYISGLSSGTSNLGATLWTKRVDDTNFNVGVEVRTANSTSTTYTTTAYPTAQTMMVVVSYTFNTATTADDVVKLWINPVIGAVEPTPTISDTHTGTDFTDIRNFFFRQDSNTETPNLQIDELRIGTTWSDVTGANLSTTQNEIAGFSMYPNPVSNGKLFISSDNNIEKTVAIYDLIGKEIINQTVTNELNISSLTAGVYVVKVTEEGKTATRKLVVQ